MLLDRLDYVMAVAEVQNLTRAAQRLHISQPALTMYLNRLERELGVKLFDRSKSPVQMTQAGRYYLDEMKKVLAATQGIVQDLQAIADPCRVLRVGIGQVRGNHWLPIILPVFCRRYPQINIHVTQSTESRLIDSLREDKVDLVFGVLPPSACQQLETEALFSAPEALLLAVHSRFGLVPEPVRSQYGFCRPYPIAAEVLQGKPFIVPEAGNGLYEFLQYILNRYSLHPSRTITVTNMTTGLQLAAKGLGVQLIYAAAPRWIQVPQVEQLDFCVLEPMPVNHPCVAAYRGNNIKAEYIQALIRIVQQEIGPLMEPALLGGRTGGEEILRS